MSGSTIGGFVGAFVGFFVGAPQLGFMIGSALGGYIDPDKVYGPRLTDAQAQTSQVGVPIPIGYGTFSVKGNIIWADVLKERKKKERAGKGGPTQVTYQYTRSYAIGICDGPIKAIKTIKRNGKVVYEAGINASGDYTGDTSTLEAESRKFLQRCTIYIGDEAQMPDPTIEAVKGVGNVAPHRGLAYVVIKDDDLTDFGGAVPQYDFVVVMDGEIGEDIDTEIAPGRMSEFADASWPLLDPESDYTYTYYSYAETTGIPIDSIEEGLQRFRDGGRNPHYIGYSFCSPTSVTLGIGLDVSGCGVSNFNEQASVVDSKTLVLIYNDVDADTLNDTASGSWCSTTPFGSYTQNRRGTISRRFSSDPGDPWIFVESCGSEDIYSLFSMQIRVTRKRVAPLSPPRGIRPLPDAPGYYVTVDGELVPIRDYTEVSGTYRVLSIASGPGNQYSWYENAPAIEISDPNFSDEEYWTLTYDAAVIAGKVPSGWTYGVDYPITVGSAFEGETSTLPTIDRDRVTLASIVADLCDRSGLDDNQIDVSALTDLVDGYVVATIGGADAFISSLSQAYFFDIAEWDAKVRFVKRGGNSVFSLGPEDYAERDGPAIEEQRVQEPELLRKTTVAYIDPAAGFTPATQAAERTVTTIKAIGESAIEIPVAMTAEDSARVADKRMKVAWSETEKVLNSLTYRYSYLTPTDVGNFTDSKGKVHRVRIMDGQEDSGVVILESTKDSQSAYVSNANGVEPTPPTTTSPGLIGGTILALLNIAVLRDENDQLGIYVGARGQLSGWRGADIQISTDGGITGDTFTSITTPATIGYTLTPLAAAVVDYPTDQAVDVFLPDPPESVDYSTLLRYYNRAVIDDEIIQYQSVTDLGGNTYRLSGLVRNRYDTSPISHAAGAMFTLIDSSLVFVQAQQWMLGMTLYFRAVSFGTSADSYEWEPYVFDKAVSQTEWGPKMLRAYEDGSDIVVTWLGRGRLGTTSRAYHSQYFRGYRVTYTNGMDVVTHDVNGTTDTLVGGVSLPGLVTITVAGLNSLTGVGTPSEAISA